MRHGLLLLLLLVTILGACGGSASSGETSVPSTSVTAAPTTTEATEAPAPDGDSSADSDGASADLAPPGAAAPVSQTAGLTYYQTNSSFEEVVDHYRQVIGEEVNLSSDSGLGSATFLQQRQGSTVVVSIEEQSDLVLVAVSGP